ncbi:MAG TPA: ABC-F family ATP-binding cassette domain-containing protein, partial [Bacillota bacterium]|nr:ABC-F family ATP-binding cassette domain-containing protein [Bacillota bacterium]
MIVLACENISKSFGINRVLDHLSFTANKGTCTGIVGANGTGKTTLFEIITGEIPYDSGNIHKAKDISMGYLPQNSSIDSDKTIWEELLDVYEPLLVLEKNIRSLENDISKYKDTSSLDYQDLASRYAKVLDEFEKGNGYGYESQMRGVLVGLGFSSDEFNQPIWQLSGGQKTRVGLAKLLLTRPEILLLDEPTNHLDLSAVQWLEAFLKNYQGTILIISHDRYFLDSLCDRILEIENHKCISFSGNYSEYRRKKTQQRAKENKEYALQQKEIARQEAIIKRYRQFNRERSVKAAESRQKMLDKMTTKDRPVDNEDIRLSFKAGKHCGRDVLDIAGLSMGFDNNLLFDDVSFHMKKGDRVGIIGANGSGKTTMFKLLLGSLKPISGAIKYGTGIDIGYYDQEQDSLNMDNSLIDELSYAFPDLTVTQIRNTLALFLFRDDDVFKKIYTLSGGERGRLMLAKLMLAQNNFLLLDEPTNHLDMASNEVLENALKDYDGSMLVITHDRYFLNKIANCILVLEDKKIKEYQGNYDDYIEKEKLLNLLNSGGADRPELV